MSTSATTATDVLAQMPHKTLTEIEGKPTYKKLLKLREEIYTNLAAIDNKNGYGNGHVGIAMPDTTYVARYGSMYYLCADPGAYSSGINDKTTDWKIRKLKAEHKIKVSEYNTEQAVINTVKSQIETALPWHAIAGIANKTTKLRSVMIEDTLVHLFDKYKIRDYQIEANTKALKEPIDLDAGFDAFVDCQETCREISQDGGDQFSEFHMIRVSNKIMAQTNLFERDCKAWNAEAEADKKKWSHWKKYWTKAVLAWNEYEKLQSSDWTASNVEQK